MRIFLTGATGSIGSAVLDALVRAGHQVTALVRDNEKAARVSAKGAHPVVGSLADPESYRATADAQDGYIHTAFDSSGNGLAIDRQTIATLLAAARRPRTTNAIPTGPRFLVATSSLWVFGRASEPTDESAPINPVAVADWRVEHENLVLDARSDQLRTAIVRPGVVYGGGTGMIGDLFKMASNGLVRVIGDGNNHWPLVYERDLADLFTRIATNDDASGVFNANDEGDETVNDIVAAISPYLSHRPDVRYVPLEEARTKMGPVADALALDQVIRSTRSRALGWNPSLHSVGGNAARLLEEWRASRA
ncbi:MAG TPA: NAD-dependent epimerase/dehydratase family protein [Vicinamibacterales bacterium]|nr:NAD-dependent epimerase/dehydratase family protein [Vicinamibacterales bacterium]